MSSLQEVHISIPTSLLGEELLNHRESLLHIPKALTYPAHTVEKAEKQRDLFFPEVYVSLILA